MSNPITSWIFNSMESTSDLERRFEDRVGEIAVNSQKLFDERHNSHRPDQFWKVERRDKIANRYIASSAYKNTSAGYCSSFQAASYYNDLAVAKRAELITEILAEEKEQASK
eukprot:CAMPEP_0195530556 /NCGR_PEP_ID=MMETSP0794_2-20130614/33489_1 /TAXON_ID=515487 /ORGANISM="Stephanopyxis turris, Strain CCMP 815" /LENGTH=111 /DNA_ID=CAMNT_0040662093 /DNA_START=65 /DNA_END=400 /DNA_ORIENTATION=-